MMQRLRATAVVGMLSACLYALSMGLLVPSVWAAEVTISARYHADPSGKFENTTPKGTFCTRFESFGFTCGDKYTFDLPFSFAKDAVHGSPNLRERLYFKYPTDRVVTVSNEYGASYDVTLHFNVLSYYIRPLDGGRIWGFEPEGGCIRFASRIINDREGAFLWPIVDITQPCYVKVTPASPPAPMRPFEITEVAAAVELVIPPPHGMAKGMYRGQVTFSAGPGGDFDFGDGVTDLGDSSVTFNIELDVRHDLFMQFPANSDQAMLEPPGGWGNWLGGRGVPGKLYRDLPFRIWNTGPLKVYKQCEYDNGGHCAIRESGGHEVPLHVALTMPGELAHRNAPIERMPIPTGEGAALDIDALRAAWNRPAALHFEVVRDDIPAMLNHPGSRYEGLVTVMFDADL